MLGRLVQSYSAIKPKEHKKEISWLVKNQPTSVEHIASAGAEEKNLPPHYCLYPWMTLYLAADMTSKVCCYMSAEENLGNFSSGRDVSEIWHGPKLTEIRNYIASGRVHPACRVCVEHGSYKSYESALKLLEDKLKDDSLVDIDALGPEINDFPEDRIAAAYETGIRLSTIWYRLASTVTSVELFQTTT